MHPRIRTFAVAAIVLCLLAAAALMPRGSSPTSSGTAAAPQPTFAGAQAPAATPALARLDVRGASFQTHSDGERAYIVSASLPDGTQTRTRYALGSSPADITSEPAPEPGSPLRGFRLTHTATATTLQWSYRYVAPRSSFPGGDLTLASGAPAHALFGRLLSVPVARLHAAQDDGVEVIVQGEVIEAAKDVLGRAEEHLGGSGATTAYGGAVLSLSEAWQTSAGYRKLKQRLAALRRCAENPTNPLTRKMYSEDPGARQRILDEISAVEAEITMDTVVRFVAALNSQGADLAGVKWLGFVVGPLTSWADSRIASLGEQRVADLERSITSCETTGPWSGTVTYSITGTGTPVVPHGSGTQSRDYWQIATVVGTETENPNQIVLTALVTARGVIAGQSSSRVEVHGRCYEDTPRILAQLTTNENKHRFELNADGRETISIHLDPSARKYDLSFEAVGGEAKGHNERHGMYTDNCRGTSTPTDEVDDTPAYFESDAVTASGTYESSGALPSSLTGEVTQKRVIQGIDEVITIRWELTRSGGTSNRRLGR